MDLTAKGKAFVQKYQGQMIAFQNNAEVPAGSCMNVPHQFIYEVLGITDPHIIYGASAYMVYTNFASLPASKFFTQVPNTPSNVPSAGDIPVFGQCQDMPDGHICLFVSGDVNSFISFDMDYPYGSTAHLQTHNYNNLLGWLHFNDPASSTTQNVAVTDSQVTDQLNAEIEALNSCQTQLKEAASQNATLQTQLTSVQDQLQSSEENLVDAKSQATTLQKQLAATQAEIVNLHGTIEAQAKTGLDDSTQILDLSHEKDALTSSLNSIVDGLGVSRTGKTLDQITKDALSKEDDLDLILKAAGVATGILHNVAKELNLDDPNATDQQIGNKIIQYVKKISLKSLIPSKNQTTENSVPSQNLFSRFIRIWWT